MHGETKPASAVRLFTSQFNSTKCAAADILQADAAVEPSVSHFKTAILVGGCFMTLGRNAATRMSNGIESVIAR